MRVTPSCSVGAGWPGSGRDTFPGRSSPFRAPGPGRQPGPPRRPRNNNSGCRGRTRRRGPPGPCPSAGESGRPPWRSRPCRFPASRRAPIPGPAAAGPRPRRRGNPPSGSPRTSGGGQNHGIRRWMAGAASRPSCFHRQHLVRMLLFQQNQLPGRYPEGCQKLLIRFRRAGGRRRRPGSVGCAGRDSVHETRDPRQAPERKIGEITGRLLQHHGLPA